MIDRISLFRVTKLTHDIVSFHLVNPGFRLLQITICLPNLEIYLQCGFPQSVLYFILIILWLLRPLYNKNAYIMNKSLYLIDVLFILYKWNKF